MPRRTNLDWAFEVISLVLLLAMFAYLAANWAELPGRVPTHYGADGNPNAWGSKGALWLMPIVAAASFLVMTAASSYQRLINLPIRVDRDLPEVQRLLLTMSIRLKTALMLMMAYITWTGINVALGRTQGLGLLFLPIFLAVTFAPIIDCIRKLRPYRV